MKTGSRDERKDSTVIPLERTERTLDSQYMKLTVQLMKYHEHDSISWAESYDLERCKV